MTRLLRVNDVARILGISEQVVRRRFRSGELPAVKIGSFWYLPECELEKLFGKGGENHAA